MHDMMVNYLLSIRGMLAPSALDAARSIHNETAGAPANVEAARSLGDLSHMVYVPLEHHNGATGEFLILDIWNNIEGLNQFFANPHVQEQGGRIFSQRDPVVWMPAEGFVSYQLPAPFGKNDRTVGLVRGMLPSIEIGREFHNRIITKFANKARRRGHLSHNAYLRLTPPDAPPSLEFFAVDTWMDAAGMGEHYQDPDFLSAFDGMFTAEATADVWTHPNGMWVEW